MRETWDKYRLMRVPGRRLALPLGLIVLSLWLLVGCLYLPTGENVHLTGSKKDFRSMPGYDAAQKPRVAGRFTRRGIEGVLGRPPYASDNGRRVMYVIHVKTGLAFAPLCFTARDRSDDCVGLILSYDESDGLTGWRKLDMPVGEGQFGEPYGFDSAFTIRDNAEKGLLSRANQNDDGTSMRPATDVNASDVLKPAKAGGR